MDKEDKRFGLDKEDEFIIDPRTGKVVDELGISPQEDVSKSLKDAGASNIIDLNQERMKRVPEEEKRVAIESYPNDTETTKYPTEIVRMSERLSKSENRIGAFALAIMIAIGSIIVADKAIDAFADYRESQKVEYEANEFMYNPQPQYDNVNNYNMTPEEIQAHNDKSDAFAEAQNHFTDNNSISGIQGQP